jgi:hypothetical protein
MDKAEFWQIIAQSKAQANNSQEVQAKALAEVLNKLSADEIIEFKKHFTDLMDYAYRWDLWAAAYIIGGGGCSDEDFIDFRSWLISRGEATFEAAVNNPDSLADYLADPDLEEPFFEDFLYVANDVFADQTGAEMPLYHRDISSEPQGEEWENHDNLKAKFPKLWAICDVEE